MGHAFQDTIMDALIRYHRMLGRNTLWQVGTDHAGIATQMVVERQLSAAGINRRELGRAAFVERVWQWTEQSGDTIATQLRRLGASVDWSRHRFTMDENLSRAVLEVFVQLYDKGLIYRGKRLVNWDPVLHTAVSDLEVKSEEERGHLWHFRYPLEQGSGHLVVATTRPETMLGDTAVAVHPTDARYANLVGKNVRLPLTERSIPVIADEYVDPEFGSGCVKITPAHDFNDSEVGERHALPRINIFDPDAKLNHNAPQAYRGLDRFDARRQVVADLEALNLVDKIEEHTSVVPRGDRSGAVVEPYLTDQWFVKTRPLAEPAIRAVANGDVRFVPENWAKTYFEWMHHIQDWCISRQLWWGHRIPAWYDDQGRVYVGRSEDEVRQKDGLGPDVALRQDEDVLDTWFSSALWPFSTLGWPDETPERDTFFPTAVLVTGFDIIFFWVARMIMMSLEFMGEVPFREVYIHGLLLDHEGQKMSKAKGNILDPLDLVDGVDLDTLLAKRTSGLMQPEKKPQIEAATRGEFPDGIPAMGTDALRFTFAALATTGREIRFDLSRIEGYHKFCNKLWNAARFVLMNTEGKDCGAGGSPDYSLADRWIRSRLAHTVEQFRIGLEEYRLDLAAQAIYEFTWHEFCDWYLELSKAILQSEASGEALVRGTRQTLAEVLEALLRVLHPLTPFITEEIWTRVARVAGIEGETIMLQPFPRAQDYTRDEGAERDMGWVMQFVLGVRQIRGEMDIAPGRPLAVLLQDATELDLKNCAEHELYLQNLARIASVEVVAADTEPPPSAMALLDGMKILVPMADLIDREAESARLQRRKSKCESELGKAEGKLAKPGFVNNAPAVVVEKERLRTTELKREIAQLQAQLELIGRLD